MKINIKQNIKNDKEFDKWFYLKNSLNLLILLDTKLD